MVVDASLMVLFGAVFTLFGFRVIPAQWILIGVPEARRERALKTLRIVGVLLLVIGGIGFTLILKGHLWPS